LVMAYFNDFPRGYYIAVLMALAVFLMIWINQPYYPAVIGALIILPGLVLFIRFLMKYPLPKGD
jgi:L-lactate permease